MKKKMVLMILAFNILVVTGCAAQQARVSYIGVEAAKAVALESAGFSEKEAKVTSVNLDERNGIEYYDVDFTADGQSYEYDVDAITGVIIDYENSVPAQVIEKTEVSADEVKGTVITPDSGLVKTVSINDSLIGEDKAMEIALSHAGLTKEQATFVKTGLDRDDGRRVYDVEFYGENFTEYDYDIDAVSGEILSFDADAEYFAAPAAEAGGAPEPAPADASGESAAKSTENAAAPAESAAQPAENSTQITKEQAKELALAQVPGAKESDIWEFEIDYDDGRLEYEGKIYYNAMEYEFEIDGYSGAIRNWEVESIYD